ncbi:MAG: glycoside hydrolase domain-containing protein [Streptosporangiaceae bacterium]
MLRPWLSRPARHASRLVAGIASAVVVPARQALAAAALATTALAVASALVVGAVFAGGRANAAATFAARLKAVSYRGYTFEVPAAWPVLNLARHPSTCVRFDLHAVYLGTPGANERCPSWLLGVTEALVIQPGARRARRSSVENPVSNLITVSAPRIRLIATFDNDPSVIYRVLASARLPAPTIQMPDPRKLSAKVAGGRSAAQAKTADARSSRASPARPFGVAKPALPALVANDKGLGFDSCEAPSRSYMTAWRRRSPYRAVGIYIGGSNRSCDQANLTPAWVRWEAAAGWRFIPMYVGPQAAFGQLWSPARQGKAAARDAAAQAERLGFGPRTPIYYDMEAYPRTDARRALSFVFAWTAELHRLGYFSGVYSSSSAGIVDLARDYRAGKFAAPDVIYDALWNGLANTSDSVYGRGEWTGGRRLHQFSGNVFQSFGGDKLYIDQDYLDLTLATPGGTTQAGPAAAQAHGHVAVFYRGSDQRLWEVSRIGNGSWRRTDLGGHLTSEPTVVQVNTGELDVFYRGSGGYLWQRKHTSSGWQRARKLALMGSLGGGPRAVAQPNGVIDVFWKGSHDDHLWHGQYSPGEGWTGPQNLRGSLASWPYPAETRLGQVQVFWKGTNGDLWHVVRGLGLPFTQPVDLGMGPLGGPPRAVALPSGEIDVFWQGRTHPSAIWAAVLRGHHVQGPSRLSGVVSRTPWPVVGAGTERVLYRGTDGRLWMLSRAPGGRWAPPSVVGLAGSLRSGPFAVVGPDAASVEVFWTAANGQLVTVGLTKSDRWARPVDVGSGTG